MIKRTGSVAEVRQQVKPYSVCSERGFGKLPERY